MSLTTKHQMKLALQAVRKLIEKVESRLLNDEDAIEIAVDMDLVSPAASEDGAMYTDKNGVIYSL